MKGLLIILLVLGNFSGKSTGFFEFGEMSGNGFGE